MLTYLDTNILIRYLTRDIESQARKAKGLIESGNVIFIPDVVFPEVAYILISQYESNRNEVIDALTSIVNRDNVKCNEYILWALSLYEKTKNDIADCIIVSQSLQNLSQLATFDKVLLKIEDVIPFKF
ncbi:MAG: type II toxin-antitoxin system VapC family toxin [bacterium]|nr:type II toxin-antitoxin system VapC family toxin [bacterium]